MKDVLLQVRVAVAGVTVAIGKSALAVIVALAEAVQPLVPVALTVYVPGVLTMIEAVAAPVLQV